MLDDLRYYRALAFKGLWRGNLPKPPVIVPQIGFKKSIVGNIGLGLMCALGIYFLEWIFNLGGPYADDIAWSIGGAIIWALMLLPFVKIAWMALRHWQRPDFSLLRYFSFAEQVTAIGTLAFLLTVCLQELLPRWLAIWQNKLAPALSAVFPLLKKWSNPKVVITHPHLHHVVQAHPIHWTFQQFIEIWLLLTALVGVIMYGLARQKTIAKPSQRFNRNKALKQVQQLPLGLWLGTSTGYLASLSHEAGIAPQQQIALFNEDLAQNIMILGGIGSGKTTRAVHPLLAQLFDQQLGGLIFDIKGDFHKAVRHFAAITQRHFTILGSQDRPMNLLAGLSPEMAASFLKSTFLLNGSRTETFWVDTATELCRNALGALSFLPQHYSLHGLHRYLFDETWQAACHNELALVADNLDKKQSRLLEGYQHYEKDIFNGFDDKVKAGVKATIAQVLAPFNHPDLIDVFCTETDTGARLEEILNGEIFLIDLPLAQWGLGGKVAYMLIKLRFFNVMQQRTLQPHWNQDKYVFFLCDEYQEIVSANKDGLSDLNFWDKSRSSKTIGIISAQSISSFYAALGDRDLTHALLQNFRQKLCFRTEDQNTIDYLNRLMGTVEVAKVTHSSSSGSTTSWENTNRHDSTSMSYTTENKPLLDGQFFRVLSSDCALAVLSLKSGGYDDVLKMQPFFL